MPDDYTTFRFEVNHRGRMSPTSPDLRRTATRLNLALLITL
jgi:hypothetical protein